jgi:hypothetical protein
MHVFFSSGQRRKVLERTFIHINECNKSFNTVFLGYLEVYQGRQDRGSLVLGYGVRSHGPSSPARFGPSAIDLLGERDRRLEIIIFLVSQCAVIGLYMA